MNEYEAKLSVCHFLFLSLLSALLTFVCLLRLILPDSYLFTQTHTQTVSYPVLTLTSVIMLWCFHVLLSVWNGDTHTFLPEQFIVAHNCTYLRALIQSYKVFADVCWHLRVLEQLFKHVNGRSKSFTSIIDSELVVKGPLYFFLSLLRSSYLITAHINIIVWLDSHVSYWSLPVCHFTTGTSCGFSPQNSKSHTHIHTNPCTSQ